MKRVMHPETTRHVCLYRSATRVVAPAAQAFGEFVAEWLKRWHNAQARGAARRR
jgi:hypothetical protein